MLKQPGLLLLSVEENVRPTRAVLQELLELSDAQVRQLVLRFPGVLTLSAEGNLRPTVAESARAGR